MKKVIIPVLMVCFSFAQFEAGKKSVGGGVNFVRFSTTTEYTGSVYGDDLNLYSGEVSEEDATTTFFLMPTADYFVIDNLSLGMALSYTMTTQSSTTTVDGDEVSSWETPSDADNPLGFGFYGKYFQGFAYGHAGYFEPDNTVDGDEYLALGGGYMYQLADGIFIDTKVSYRHMLNGDDAATSDTSGDVTVTNMVLYGTVGISVVF